MNIYDIAKLSGVSIATVSRVLNGSDRVSEQTKMKVESVMNENGYQPNAFARGLGFNSMKFIGILCDDLSDSFNAKAVSLIENALRQKGFSSILCGTDNKISEKQKALSSLLEKRADAVILIGSSYKDKDTACLNSITNYAPVIIINGLMEKENVYCVYCDDYSAVENLVLSLSEQNCDRIVYLHTVPQTFSDRQKYLGYKAGCDRAGIRVRDELLLTSDKSSVTACAAMDRLCNRNCRISAVIASDDLLAAGAIKSLRKHGLTNVPVIGYNNSILAECTTPTLSSVDNMLSTMCGTAVNLLIDVTNGQQVPNKIVLNSRLMERESFQMIKNKTPAVV